MALLKCHCVILYETLEWLSGARFYNSPGHIHFCCGLWFPPLWAINFINIASILMVCQERSLAIQMWSIIGNLTQIHHVLVLIFMLFLLHTSKLCNYCFTFVGCMHACVRCFFFLFWVGGREVVFVHTKFL